MKNIEIKNNMASWEGSLERPGWWTGKQKFKVVPYIADDGHPDFSIENQIWGRFGGNPRPCWKTVDETGATLGWSKEKIDDLKTFVFTHAMYDVMLQISGHESKIK